MLKPPPAAPGAKLRALMAEGTVLLPGVFNAISARAATVPGANGLYLSGAGATNALLGVPDHALITLSELAQIAATVTQVTDLPVLSDADTGFGETMNVSRTVIEMERAGLAGIHLEDQVSPKRCGHLDGKAVIPAEQMATKILAAVESKRDPSFLIVARTDARGVEGLDAAIDRAKAYVQCGADAIFPEGLASEAEFEAFRKGVDAPLLANMTEFGKTPILPFSRFRDLGYNLVIYPMTAFRVMLKALSETYSELIETGSQESLLPKMKTRAELYELIEYDAYTSRDQEWANRAKREIGDA
jgi:methylisocitrate lyase